MLVGYNIFITEEIAWAEIVKEIEIVSKLRDLIGDYGLKRDRCRDQLNVFLLQFYIGQEVCIFRYVNISLHQLHLNGTDKDDAHRD